MGKILEVTGPFATMGVCNFCINPSHQKVWAITINVYAGANHYAFQACQGCLRGLMDDATTAAHRLAEEGLWGEFEAPVSNPC